MTLALKATSREKLGKEVKEVRKEGLVPAVLYGKKQKSTPVQVDAKVLTKLYNEAGESTLIDLSVDEKNSQKVLIHDYTVDAVTQKPIHVDFYAVDMAEEIEAEIDLRFVGESKAVKELGGVLVKNHSIMNIKCLPGNLISELDVDVSGLNTFDDKVTYGDLRVPEGITILDKPTVVVAFVAEPRSEKELEELDEKIEEKVDDVAVEEKGKEPEEGEEVEGDKGDKKEEPKKDDKKDK